MHLSVLFVWPECIVNDEEVIVRSTQVKILKGDLQKCNDENYFNVYFKAWNCTCKNESATYIGFVNWYTII